MLFSASKHKHFAVNIPDPPGVGVCYPILQSAQISASPFWSSVESPALDTLLDIIIFIKVGLIYVCDSSLNKNTVSFCIHFYSSVLYIQRQCNILMHEKIGLTVIVSIIYYIQRQCSILMHEKIGLLMILIIYNYLNFKEP